MGASGWRQQSRRFNRRKTPAQNRKYSNERPVNDKNGKSHYQRKVVFRSVNKEHCDSGKTRDDDGDGDKIFFKDAFKNVNFNISMLILTSVCIDSLHNGFTRNPYIEKMCFIRSIKPSWLIFIIKFFFQVKKQITSMITLKGLDYALPKVYLTHARNFHISRPHLSVYVPGWGRSGETQRPVEANQHDLEGGSKEGGKWGNALEEWRRRRRCRRRK